MTYVTCIQCGAQVLSSMRELHKEWHEELLDALISIMRRP